MKIHGKDTMVLDDKQRLSGEKFKFCCAQQDCAAGKFKTFYVRNQVPNAADVLRTSQITPVQCRFFCRQIQICLHANLV
jgi:hypothetical protein